MMVLSLSATTAGAAPAQRETVESIVAVVNDDVITRTELDNRLRAVKDQLKNRPSPLPPDAVLENRYWTV